MKRPAKRTKKRMNDIPFFVLSIVICQGAGLVGALVTIPAIPAWYATLPKPSFTPPTWVFGPVWTILFFLMGVSLSLIWRNGGNLLWFRRQLMLNVLWSILFFGLKSPVGAFADIIFLWYAIYQTILSFQKTSRWASYLLYPYLAWVSFAAVLNFAIVLLEK